MTAIPSKLASRFDTSAASFMGVASDLGEAIGLLAGGTPADSATRARLCQSLRSLQGFLIFAAEEQAALEDRVREDMVRAVLAARRVTLPPPVQAVPADPNPVRRW